MSMQKTILYFLKFQQASQNKFSPELLNINTYILKNEHRIIRLLLQRKQNFLSYNSFSVVSMFNIFYQLLFICVSTLIVECCINILLVRIYFCLDFALGKLHRCISLSSINFFIPPPRIPTHKFSSHYKIFSPLPTMKTFSPL